jgi:PAS domain S-box-containing protein
MEWLKAGTMQHSENRRMRWLSVKGYLVALVAVLAASVVRLSIAPLMRDRSPVLACTIAIVVAAWYGGRGPGIFAAMLSGAVAWALFYGHAWSDRLHEIADMASAAGFVATGGIVSVLIGGWRESKLRLERSAEARKALIESAPPGILGLDAAGRIDLVNESAARMFGYARERLVGQPLEFLVPKDARRPRWMHLHELHRGLEAAKGAEWRKTSDPGKTPEWGKASGQGNRREPRNKSEPAKTYALTGRRVNGEEFPLELSVTHIHGEAGPQTIVFVQDVTERERAQQALRTSEERLSLAQASAGIGIWDWNLAAGCAVFSDEYRRIFGVLPHEELGPFERWLTHVHPEDAVRVREETEMALSSTGVIDTQFRIVWPDHSVRWVMSKGKLFRDTMGAPERVLGIVMDITQHKRADEALEEANRALEASNEDLKRFGWAASHDLQEPLRMVTAFTQLLEQRYADRLDASGREFIQYAVEGASRMELLLQSLREYWEISERREIQLQWVDMNRVLEEAQANLKMRIESTGATICTGRLPMIVAEPAPMVTLLQNLLSNAIKYTQPGAIPRVRIESEEHAGEWIFTVRDSGIGIPREHHEQIFAVFKRLHGRQVEGAGVGLAICQRIVERHGGRIWVESEPGQGAAFHFTIPSSPKN